MATWLSRISRQLRVIRKNAFLWCGVYLLTFCLLIARLGWLQILEGRHYHQIAALYHTRVSVLRATRGRLLDRNHKVLALDDQRHSLFVDPALVEYPDFLAQQLAPVLHLPPADIISKLTYQCSSAVVKGDLTEDQASRLRTLVLPCLQVVPEGHRYRIGIDVLKAQPGAGFAEELAPTLNLTPKELIAQLGDLTTPPADDQDANAAPPSPRWIAGDFGEEAKQAVETLHFHGMLFTPTGNNYALQVDPREYLKDNPAVSARIAAKALAPILNIPETTIISRLQFRTRYVPLLRKMPDGMDGAITQLQATIFVVEPGKILETRNGRQTPDEALNDAADRIYNMLNGAPSHKHDPAAAASNAPMISKEEIRNRLLPGAAPGPIGIKLTKGQPDISITRRLFAKPIPGVIYGLPGVSMQSQPIRRYPFGKLAAATLGFVSHDEDDPQGAFGLETAENGILRGKNGREVKEIDARHMTIPEHSKRTEAVDGGDVSLTLDLNIQQAAEIALDKAVQNSRALRGECIVMDPQTGEILALANSPGWDANAPGNSTTPLMNPTISNFYEPGSTFKTLTVMASLEEGIIRDGQLVTNCTGAMQIGKKVIHEAHAERHGQVDCEGLLEQSCNLGAATLSLRLGPENFMKWADRLGFGTKTGIELANESPGYLNKKNVNAHITLANMGFGQSLAVTPLQMVALYSAVANGGMLVNPHLVMSWVRPDGTIAHAPIQRRRVCSEQTAKLLRGYLEQVVSGKKGTGKNAAIPGYAVAGKTGTAQKPGPHGYSSGKAIGSFIGFLPADKPRLTVIVVIDEPQSSHYGGVVAAPVVSEVGRQALQYLNIPPNVPVKPKAATQ